MKIIFLDHDGVMCLKGGERFSKTKKCLKKYGTEFPVPIYCRLDNFDKKAIKILNDILEKTNAEIVVSSDWKLHCTLEEMQELYKHYGISKSPIAFTPNFRIVDENANALYEWKGWKDRIRMEEIGLYIKNNHVDKWVAVDDINMIELDTIHGGKRFVHVKWTEGIKQTGIKEKVLSILS